ncbi:MAG: SDR family oxidoreductase [Proteobacteria bacterium]|nr:SDR family oxidoreductase [Pseudomonadota bacterium]MBU1451731.1 SDR family oxidoreductase [Pseudomonadota bacterium]MBU2469267.1 SDR family oxidoreductase [Pseudomonadota bacterium]MBU2517551.1 SDR family oxidoreductase [Pseudomonadota bacterium]
MVVLVTGAAGGIGRAVALRLAREGARVAAQDIDKDGCRQTAQAVLDLGGQALAVWGDVSRESDAEAFTKAATDHFGGIDVLVNNAGLDLSSPCEQTDLADWERALAVDLTGAFICSKHAHAWLKRSPAASVVNIASIHARNTQAHRTAYAAAKAGLLGFTKSLALEWGPEGIRVNAILPGYIQTDIWRLWLEEENDPQALLERLAKHHPLRRLGAPDDVAAAVAFLASTDAGFITGSTLVVDGGLTSMFATPAEI